MAPTTLFFLLHRDDANIQLFLNLLTSKGRNPMQGIGR